MYGKCYICQKDHNDLCYEIKELDLGIPTDENTKKDVFYYPYMRKRENQSLKRNPDAFARISASVRRVERKTNIFITNATNGNSNDTAGVNDAP